MTLIRYRRRMPSALAAFREEVNDLFSRFFEGEGWPFSREGGWTPALDIAERDDAIVVEAELPGMSAEDIDISVEGDTLIIRGEKMQQREEKGETYYHTERRYGSFKRTIPLPSTVEADKIEATHKDGVLKITLPKSQASLPKKIKVKTE